MFQDFFRKEQTYVVPSPSDSTAIHNLLNDEYNESLSEVLDLVMMEEKTKEIQDVAITSVLQTLPYENKYTKVLVKNAKEGEYSNTDDRSPNCKRVAHERTPENQIIKLQDVFIGRPLKKNNPRRRLNFSYERPVNLKLSAIYEYMFGSNFAREHSAEADCLAMIRCVSQITNFFLEWSDNHAFPLIHCKKK